MEEAVTEVNIKLPAGTRLRIWNEKKKKFTFVIEQRAPDPTKNICQLMETIAPALITALSAKTIKDSWKKASFALDSEGNPRMIFEKDMQQTIAASETKKELRAKNAENWGSIVPRVLTSFGVHPSGVLPTENSLRNSEKFLSAVSYVGEKLSADEKYKVQLLYDAIVTHNAEELKKQKNEEKVEKWKTAVMMDLEGLEKQELEDAQMQLHGAVDSAEKKSRKLIVKVDRLISDLSDIEEKVNSLLAEIKETLEEATSVDKVKTGKRKGLEPTEMDEKMLLAMIAKEKKSLEKLLQKATKTGMEAKQLLEEAMESCAEGYSVFPDFEENSYLQERGGSIRAEIVEMRDDLDEFSKMKDLVDQTIANSINDILSKAPVRRAAVPAPELVARIHEEVAASAPMTSASGRVIKPRFIPSQ